MYHCKDFNLNKPLINIFIITIISVLSMADVSAAKFYRFTDAAGKLVVSSTLPPEVSQLGYEIVNEMGVVLETYKGPECPVRLSNDYSI